MATQFPQLALPHQSFIAAQHLFFVATAATTGRANLSPKGMDCLRVLGPTAFCGAIPPARAMKRRGICSKTPE